MVGQIAGSAANNGKVGGWRAKPDGARVRRRAHGGAEATWARGGKGGTSERLARLGERRVAEGTAQWAHEVGRGLEGGESTWGENAVGLREGDGHGAGLAAWL